MLKLRRLRIEKFRSLVKGAELSFSDGINVLLGQNGTGKTTLLELISMVVRSDFTSLAKEEFAIEYELAASEGESIVVVVRNEPQAMEQLPTPFEVGMREVYQPSAEVRGGADHRRLVRYDAEGGITVGDGPPAGSAGLSPLDPAFLSFFIGHISAGREELNRHLLRAVTAHRFDESLDIFRRITGGDTLGEVVALLDLRVWVPITGAWFLLPDDLVKKMIAPEKPNRADYSFAHDEVSFLAALKDMMDFSSSELRVDVTERNSEHRRARRMHLGNLVFRFGWEDGTFITHERLSYGQKRLVTFFYYLACNPDIVIADELVNGLHHRWITASIEALGQRQAFLTSQNPLLLDYIPIPSAEAVRRSFVLCRGEPREGRPGWIWENMSEDDAGELFSAYEVGVEHVSEILQSRGLW